MSDRKIIINEEAFRQVGNNNTVKLLLYILDNRSIDNNFISTYNDIVLNTGITYSSVFTCMKKLEKLGFITKIYDTIYKVNSEIIKRGEKI